MQIGSKGLKENEWNSFKIWNSLLLEMPLIIDLKTMNLKLPQNHKFKINICTYVLGNYARFPNIPVAWIILEMETLNFYLG